MGNLIPIGVNWEVEISQQRWNKLFVDVLIFKRIEDDPDRVKQLVLLENSNDTNGTKWELKEAPLGVVMPTIQLPRETLEPLAKALYGMGIDGGSGSKLAGKVEAQAEHLKDLRQIVLSFIGGKNAEPEVGDAK